MTGEAEETPWVQSSLLTRCGASDAARARPSPVDEQEKRKRNLLIITGILVLLWWRPSSRWGSGAQIPFASNLIVFFLFNLNLIVFLLLLVLLFPQPGQLSFERRQKIIGSKFRPSSSSPSWPCPWCPYPDLPHRLQLHQPPPSRAGSSRRSRSRLDQAMEVAQTYYQSLETTALRHGATWAV